MGPIAYIIKGSKIKNLPRYNWNIVESGVKHHKPNPKIKCTFMLNHNLFTCILVS